MVLGALVGVESNEATSLKPGLRYPLRNHDSGAVIIPGQLAIVKKKNMITTLPAFHRTRTSGFCLTTVYILQLNMFRLFDERHP